MRTNIVKKKSGKVTEKRTVWTVDLGAWLNSGWMLEDSPDPEPTPEPQPTPEPEPTKTIETKTTETTKSGK